MSTDETPHRPSAGEDDDADAPEQRIERRWRPASDTGATRSGGPAQDRSPPQHQAADEAAGGPPTAPPPKAPSAPPNAPADAEAPKDEDPPATEEGLDGQSSSDGAGDAAFQEATGRQSPEASPSSSGTSGSPEGPTAASAEQAPDPSSAPDDGDQPVQDREGGQEPASNASTADREAARDEGKRINEEALSDASDDHSWSDALEPDENTSPSERDPDAPPGDKDFFTDETRRSDPADQVEEAIQDVAYRMNEDGAAPTDWMPEERKAQRIATTFALLVSKVAEDMSYQRRPGDEFWDPRKIMRRQIDNRPLQHCKMDYTKRRLALLVDTSPSCTDEAVFYSKIASGAMLRDDIDIFLCPNGHIDAKFDPEPMRFVTDERGPEWDLEGRTVLYFTDWDGREQLVAHSRDCNLYWFDNCPPDQYWDSRTDRHRRVRLRYKGQHFHCPDPDAFRSLVRKIRP
jgi:hypothetical protein